jgi:transcription elongation factor Elf1
MDKKSAVGHLSCKVCGQDFDASINCSYSKITDSHQKQRKRLMWALTDLSHPVDVYADWIDACDKAAKDAAQVDQDNGGNSQNASYRDMGNNGAPRRQREVPSDDDEDGDGDGEMDDFVENDEIDAEAEYA